MKITLDIPDSIASQLADSPETLTRRSLELLAVEAYCKGNIGAGEVGQLLGFASRWDTYDFLKQKNAEPPYRAIDMENDAATLRELLS
ncbi:UPF0175 family protein [Nodosilinea sp. P-1105]|uniref:UPF0175 family protein n=1 Tax=Nodosilinea sp. P-1105 TaxID=2546229 RepID=UPI00146E5433|nr:UPF0175 family protein [Nodosilinea sp. P-1105]NMF84525.1 UPF0175 family protein [Nodosilinea sp. P-1105]